MQYLIFCFLCVSSTFAAPTQKTELNPTAFGSYRFTFATDSQARSEARQPDGTTRGAYTYIDDDDIVHEVKYEAGASDGFKVISHDVKGNKADRNVTALDVELVNGLTPEVAAARDAHISYQASLRAVLPELKEEEQRLPTITKHVPGPARRLTLEKSRENLASRKTIFETANRKIDEPTLLKTKIFSPEPVKFEETKTERLQKPNIRTIEVEVPELLELQKLTKPNTSPKKAPAILRSRFSRQTKDEDLLSTDIKLVQGLTPEVAAAKAEHLRIYELTRAALPELKEEGDEKQ